MCTYCMMGDHVFRWNPPFHVPQGIPYVPAPLAPVNPWPLPQVIEFRDLLQRVKALEDQLGCPCEPNKADYISLLGERIAKLEEAARKAQG